MIKSEGPAEKAAGPALIVGYSPNFKNRGIPSPGPIRPQGEWQSHFHSNEYLHEIPPRSVNRKSEQATARLNLIKSWMEKTRVEYLFSGHFRMRRYQYF